MEIKLKAETIKVKDLTFDQWRAMMAEFIRSNTNAEAAWDLMTALRGPDSPSERPDMSPKEASKAYTRRRERKYRTVEIIREAAFFGTVGGQARYHKDTKVTLPPSKAWDHFDRHVARAAGRIGLEVVKDDE